MTTEMTLEEYRRLNCRARPAGYSASETSEQIALFDWIDRVTPREPRLALAFHVPNGEYRTKGAAGRLKAMGVRAGVPDVLLPVASRGYIGLAIELKVPGGRATSDQLTWLGRLTAAGWYAAPYVGWTAAALAICWYLDRPAGEMGLSDAL
jgi:hypothetical protein